MERQLRRDGNRIVVTEDVPTTKAFTIAQLREARVQVEKKQAEFIDACVKDFAYIDELIAAAQKMGIQEEPEPAKAKPKRKPTKKKATKKRPQKAQPQQVTE